MLPLGIGVMLAALHSTGKLPAAIKQRNILANLGAKNSHLIHKQRKNIIYI